MSIESSEKKDETIFRMIDSFGKATDLTRAVCHCMVQRLTTEESLAHLEEQGHKITESKLDKIKRHIRSSVRARLDHIAYNEYAYSQIEAIDAVDLVNHMLWQIATGRRVASKEELRALELIPQNIRLLEELYDSNAIVSALDKTVRGKNIVSNESKKNN